MNLNSFQITPSSSIKVKLIMILGLLGHNSMFLGISQNDDNLTRRWRTGIAESTNRAWRLPWSHLPVMRVSVCHNLLLVTFSRACLCFWWFVWDQAQTRIRTSRNINFRVTPASADYSLTCSASTGASHWLLGSDPGLWLARKKGRRFTERHS